MLNVYQVDWIYKFIQNGGSVGIVGTHNTKVRLDLFIGVRRIPIVMKIKPEVL